MNGTSRENSPQKIRIAGFLKRSAVNGPGVRAVVWVQGCPIRCRDCFNKDLWDYTSGRDTDTETLYREIIGTEEINGVTFSGGEPFVQARALAELGRLVHSKNLTVVTFTGYSYEQIVHSQDETFRLLLNETDLLISGPFISGGKKGHALTGFPGKEVHVLTGRILMDLSEPVPYGPATEFTISPAGSLSITGFPDSGLLGRFHRAGRIGGG